MALITPPQEDPKKEIIRHEDLELGLTRERMSEWFNRQLSVDVRVCVLLNFRFVSR